MFESVQWNVEILETRIRTDRSGLDCEVSGVSTQMRLQQAVLQDIGTGITGQKSQDDRIVEARIGLFEGFRQELRFFNRSFSDDAVQIQSVNATNIGIQYTWEEISGSIQDVNTVLSSITKSHMKVMSPKESREHAVQMEDQVAQIKEVNTGLTTAMEEYKLSQSSRFDFQQNTVQPGPSAMVHPYGRHNLHHGSVWS